GRSAAPRWVPLPERWSHPEPVADASATPACPFVRQHSALSLGLNAADSKRVESARDHELAGSFQHHSRLPLDAVHNLRAEQLDVTLGRRCNRARLRIGRANESRNLERAVLPVDARRL